MTTQLPTLPGMPVLVLENIANNLDVFEIQNLRAVCRSLHYFVDHCPLNVRIDRLKLTIESKSIRSEFKVSGRLFFTKYEQKRKTCYITPGKENERSVAFRGEDHVDMFLKHFKQIFINHKVAMRTLHVSSEHSKKTHTIKEKLSQLLADGRHKMKVEWVQLGVTKIEDIYDVLPHVSPDVLETIELDQDYGEKQLVISEEEINRLAELNQWKRAKDVFFFYDSYPLFLSSASVVDHFTVFESLDFEVKTLFLNGVLTIKNIVTHGTTKLEWSCIQFKRFLDKRTFQRMLGPNKHREGENSNTWYFEIPGTSDVLEISLNNYAIRISRRSYLLPNALLSDFF